MPDPRPATKSPRTTSHRPGLRGPALRRLGFVGASVVLAGAAAFGIDQVVSSPSTHSRGGSPRSGATASTLPGGLASAYLATMQNAVVSIQLMPAGHGLDGTASALATIGDPSSHSTVFVTSTVSAKLHASRLEIGFNGAPESSTNLANGSFTVEFPLPDGTMAPLTFHPTTVPAIAKAQAAFRQRVEPGSPIPARSPTTVTTRQ